MGNTSSMSHPGFFVSAPHLHHSDKKLGLARGKLLKDNKDNRDSRDGRDNRDGKELEFRKVDSLTRFRLYRPCRLDKGGVATLLQPYTGVNITKKTTLKRESFSWATWIRTS